MKQVEYRVCVIADKPGVDYFGGKKSFQKKLVGLFDNVTRFWNNGSNDFDYYFKFTPTLHAVFEGSSKDVLKTYGGDDFDFKKYDVLVMFDMIKDHADEHPGAAAGGVKNGNICWNFQEFPAPPLPQTGSRSQGRVPSGYPDILSSPQIHRK